MHYSLLVLPLIALSTACSEPPQSVADDKPYFAGQAVFTDELADIDQGVVFVNVFNQRGDRIPALCRRYDLDDPAFREGNAGLVLNFELDETHNMVGMGVPLGDKPQVEIRYDPDGAVETKDGVRSAWIAASSGDADLHVVLDRSAEVAAPAPQPTSRPVAQPASGPTSRPTGE